MYLHEEPACDFPSSSASICVENRQHAMCASNYGIPLMFQYPLLTNK